MRSSTTPHQKQQNGKHQPVHQVSQRKERKSYTWQPVSYTHLDSLRPPTLFGQVAPEYPVLQWINKECKTSNEKLTLLYFWSVRNPMAAYVDIPRFNKFVKEFGDQLNIIGLSPDSPEFITDIEPTLEFPYAYAPEAFTNFGIKIFGYCYILDPVSYTHLSHDITLR